MEENYIDSDYARGSGFEVTEASRKYLMQTARWAKLLSILGFIGVGLIVLGGIFSGTFMAMATGMDQGPMMGSVAIVPLIYFISAVIYFFPVYYLYKFAAKAKLAARDKDSMSLEESFRYQKSMFKFIGIFTIIIVSSYLFFGLSVVFLR